MRSRVVSAACSITVASLRFQSRSRLDTVGLRRGGRLLAADDADDAAAGDSALLARELRRSLRRELLRADVGAGEGPLAAAAAARRERASIRSLRDRSKSACPNSG